LSQLHDAKILVLDIETSPIEAYCWALWDQNVGLNQIKVEWSILSFAAKWLGKPKVIYEDTSKNGIGKFRDDKKLLIKLHALLDEADIVVAQNGRRFDVKKINARMVMAGLKPYSPIRIVDTLEAAKKYFSFTSNKLEWASEWLTSQKKLAHKEFPGFELWKECLAGNPKAWRVMKKYNIRDVTATEEYYIRIRPWIANHPNMGVYSDIIEHTCTNCASPNLQSRGKQRLQQGLYNRYQCQDCGKWSRGKNMLLAINKRKALLTNIGDKS
jgi:hypothetical protein